MKKIWQKILLGSTVCAMGLGLMGCNGMKKQENNILGADGVAQRLIKAQAEQVEVEEHEIGRAHV